MEQLIIEKYLRMQEQCRIRPKRYYDKYKEIILQDRKDKRKKVDIRCNFEILNLDTILNKMDKSDKITNDNTRKCHKNRITTFFQITNIHDMNKDLKNYKETMNKIENSTYGKNDIQYKSNSRKNMMESFLFCLDKLDTILFDNDIRQHYQDYYSKTKLRCNDELEIKKSKIDDGVISYKEYENRILDRFRIESISKPTIPTYLLS